jgi:hypothetical protein
MVEFVVPHRPSSAYLLRRLQFMIMDKSSCWLLVPDICEYLEWSERQFTTVAAMLVAADQVYIAGTWLRVEPATGNNLVPRYPKWYPN